MSDEDPAVLVRLREMQALDLEREAWEERHLIDPYTKRTPKEASNDDREAEA